MTRSHIFFAAGMLLVGALLLANLLRPTSTVAFDLPVGSGLPVAISSAGDSAWALVGNRVYYVTLRPRGEVQNRIINQIDVQELK